MKNPIPWQQKTLEPKKMNPLENFIATSRPYLLMLALCSAPAWADEAIGAVTQVSGPLIVKRESGTIKALALGSQVERGDVIVSESATYARITFADGSEITLRPNTQLKLAAYSIKGVSAEG
jgi:hypothetical protein